jgi:hypothetical protein
MYYVDDRSVEDVIIDVGDKPERPSYEGFSFLKLRF